MREVPKEAKKQKWSQKVIKTQRNRGAKNLKKNIAANKTNKWHDYIIIPGLPRGCIHTVVRAESSPALRRRMKSGGGGSGKHRGRQLLGKRLRMKGETLSLTSKGKQTRPRKGWGGGCSVKLGTLTVWRSLGLFLKRRCREQEEDEGMRKGTPDPVRTHRGPKQSRWRDGPKQEVHLIWRLLTGYATGENRKYTPVSFCFLERLVHMPTENNVRVRKQTSSLCL